jgi:hypothetical protein
MISAPTERTGSICGSRLSGVGWLTCRVCSHGVEQIRRETRPWPRWPREHRRHTRRGDEEIVLVCLTDLR